MLSEPLEEFGKNSDTNLDFEKKKKKNIVDHNLEGRAPVVPPLDPPLYSSVFQAIFICLYSSIF